MKFLYGILTVACLALLSVQCDSLVDPALLESPNAVSPDNVDPDFLLNNIQIEARDVYESASGLGAELTRMRYMFGSTYDNALDNQSFNNLYQTAYADVFIDVQNLLPLAEEKNLFFHSGVAKTLKAYTMITMADVFGDVPLTEALDPGNFNPGLTEGEAVYDSALTLLDSAIADLQNQNRRGVPVNDLYYGDIADDSLRAVAWIKAANTIKLKAYLNTGNAAGINNLIADGNLILVPADDFTFEYSTTSTNPDSRHPFFANNYVNGAGNYMAVNYMNMMLNDKPIRDPRMRYYFYRQTTSDPSDINLKTCLGATKPSHFQVDDPFCLLGDGWWGRDHLVAFGIPPDNFLRTTFGVYPAGGEFDADQGEGVEEDMGYEGAGFTPILMSSFTNFMLAEAALVHGTTGDSRTYLETAVTQSLETVRDFGDDQAAGTGFEMTDGIRDTYIAEVLDRWDTNTGVQDRLRNISKEYYLALWPNGLEAYNLMRRTGYPDRQDNMQPANTPNPGDWYRSFSYPANMIERNSSIEPKTSNLARVFWDTRGQDDEFNY